MKIYYIFFFILFYSCVNNNFNYDFLDSGNASSEKGFGLKMLYFSEGQKKVLLKTDLMEHFENYIFLNKTYTFNCILDSILKNFNFEQINQDSLRNLSFFSDNIVIKYYNNYGDSIFQIFSDKMTHYTNQDVVELKSNVILKNNNQDVLKTNSLFWNISKEKILALDSVIIQTEDKIIRGCGFYSDDNFENYKIYNISGIIHVNTD